MIINSYLKDREILPKAIGFQGNSEEFFVLCYPDICANQVILMLHAQPTSTLPKKLHKHINLNSYQFTSLIKTSEKILIDA